MQCLVSSQNSNSDSWPTMAEKNKKEQMEEGRKPRKVQQQSKDIPNNAPKLAQPLQSGRDKGHDAFGRA